MNDTEFGKICGISQQMVSKYRQRGLVVNDEGGAVDHFESLRLLDGHLDEDKRLAALRYFTESGTLDFSSSPVSDDLEAAAQPRRSARTLLDEYRAESALIDLQLKAGRLIETEKVIAANRNAVGAMREAFSRSRNTLQEDMVSTFAVPFERLPALRLRLKKFEAEVLMAFANKMQAQADADDEAYDLLSDSSEKPLQCSDRVSP